MEKLDIKIEGKIEEDEYTIIVNDIECDLDVSLKFREHSPTGFCWGYFGSGPAQAALAILLEVLPYRKALSMYQKFKEDFIAKQNQYEDFVLMLDLKKWLMENE